MEMKITHIASDEMSVTTTHGTAAFFPMKKKKNICRKCWLAVTDCREAKCGAFDVKARADGQVGVFSIREMPDNDIET